MSAKGSESQFRISCNFPLLGADLNFKLCARNVTSSPIYLSNLGILYIEKDLCSSKVPWQSESPSLLREMSQPD